MIKEREHGFGMAKEVAEKLAAVEEKADSSGLKPLGMTRSRGFLRRG
jgi:hypothetical protein